MRKRRALAGAVGTLVLFAAASAHASPDIRVYGYAYASDTPARWDLLTDVAFFNEPMGTDGTLPTTSWSGSGKTLVTAGHQHGVRVHLAVTLFNSGSTDNIHTFLSNATAVTNGTKAIVDAVVANGGDGVDIDFEFVAGADKALFTSFIQGLASAMHTAIPGSDVSIAMPSENYPGYDIPGLAAAADTLMIMGYDYHWGTSNPGPVSPLSDSTTWGTNLSQASTIALFKSKGADPAKLVMGLPLYGYDYPSTSNAMPGTKVAGTSATAVLYSKAETTAPTYGSQWDQASHTPYYMYQSAGEWHQCWYESAVSLAMKIDQVKTANLSGIGLWALGYESASFWSMLQTKVIPDGGVFDEDAGMGGPVDAGHVADAGHGGDAGDAGHASDAGHDASVPADAGTGGDAGHPVAAVASHGGCAMGAASGGAGGAFGVVMGVGIAMARRRRRR